MRISREEIRVVITAMEEVEAEEIGLDPEELRENDEIVLCAVPKTVRWLE
jgi:hypothetical protein